MKLRALLLLVGPLLLACSLTAQESTETSRGPDGGTRVHVTGIQVRSRAGTALNGLARSRTEALSPRILPRSSRVTAKGGYAASAPRLFRPIRMSNPNRWR